MQFPRLLQETGVVWTVELIAIIIGATMGGILLIGIILMALGCCKCRSGEDRRISARLSMLMRGKKDTEGIDNKFNDGIDHFDHGKHHGKHGKKVAAEDRKNHHDYVEITEDFKHKVNEFLAEFEDNNSHVPKNFQPRWQEALKEYVKDHPGKQLHYLNGVSSYLEHEEYSKNSITSRKKAAKHMLAEITGKDKVLALMV